MYIAIGKILRPVGLKGEVKVQMYTQTIDDAERLRGKEIFVLRDDLKLGEDELLNTDLIGFVVVDKAGKYLGTIKNVENFGASDICDCGDFSFPYEDAFVIETSLPKRKITINPMN